MKELDKVDFNAAELKLDRSPITRREIHALKTKNGGFTRKTVESLGVPFPPPSGWVDALVKYGYPLFKIQHVAKEFVEPIRKMSRKKRTKELKVRRAEIRARIRAENIAYHKKHGLAAAAKERPSSYVPTRADKDAFYLSWDWRELRKKVLNEYGSTCQCCGASPKDKDMRGMPVKIVVDHIKPISKYWDARLKRANLQILCDECNQGKGAWDETDHRPSTAPDEWIIKDDIPQALREQLTTRH